MADIRNYGPIRHLRSDASVHITRYRRGRITRAGRGLAFWFTPDSTSVAELPMDDRDMPLFFRSRSRDFQAIAVQGTLTWRVADPLSLGSRVDFSIDLATGSHVGEPVEQIVALLTGLAQQIATQYLAESPVAALLDAGIDPLRRRLEENLVGASRLEQMGIEVTAIRLSSIAPSSELERALQAPTFEALQQRADQATFERRAGAVEQERAIAENELGNRIELARREKLLIAEEAGNARSRAESLAAARQVEADSEAARIRSVDHARHEMERTRIDIYRDLPVQVLMGLAAREFAGKVGKVEHLNITPDLLSTVLGEFGRAAESRTAGNSAARQ
jgi:regulator of protease activity HflC (stomatin/prohibitin superfamily)